MSDLRKNLLFTGASGFLGSNIKPLISKQYVVKTMGLAEDEDYRVNLAHTVPSLNEHFDVVLHAAGKAHFIPVSEEEKQQFFDINYKGTVNLCKALEKSGLPSSFIFVSSVAVYGVDKGEAITEDYPLKGRDPYALSKMRAEEFLNNWCKKNNITLSIIRPSLIAGPNPPGNLGKMIKGIKTGKYLSISGGQARKSVLMVQDIAYLIPKLEKKGGVYNVCDSEQPTFRDLERLISKQLNKSTPISLPYKLTKIVSYMGDIIGSRAPINSYSFNKITNSLTFSNEKARKELDWQPLSVLKNFKIDKDS